MNERLLVLESCWDDDFRDKKTVRPFIEGWSDLADISCTFRSYNDRDDLQHWVELFYRDSIADTLYIAGHGLGTRLVGLGNRGINLCTLLPKVFKKTGSPKAVRPKGILVGACQCCGARVRSRILEDTNDRLRWVGGYSVDLPWLESTLLDLAFLHYRFVGRVRKGKAPPGASWDVDDRQLGNLQAVAKWIRDDFPLAEAWGFGVATRHGASRR